MTPMQARRCCPTTTQGSEFGSPTPRSRSPGRTGCTWTSGAPLSRTSSRPWPGPSGWAPGTSTSGSARRRVMWCSPTPKATSSASSSRATASSPTVDRSGRWRRRLAAGRVLLERGAGVAVGLGPGPGDRDPFAARRSEDQLGRSAGGAEVREEPVALRPRSACPRGRTGRGRPSRLPRSDPIDIGEGGVGWVEMLDPDGNEFCVQIPR